MSPRRRKAEDVDVFAAVVRVMLRVGPAELTLSAIAAEAGLTAAALVQMLLARTLVKEHAGNLLPKRIQSLEGFLQHNGLVAVMESRIAPVCSSTCCACSTMRAPIGVTVISTPPRSKSCTPSSSSSFLIATDSVGWLTRQASAARPK